jgi:hypothetical protein
VETNRGICLILDTQKGNFAIKILVDKQMEKNLAETFLDIKYMFLTDLNKFAFYMHEHELLKHFFTSRPTNMFGTKTWTLDFVSDRVVLEQWYTW